MEKNLVSKWDDCFKKEQLFLSEAITLKRFIVGASFRSNSSGGS